MDENLNQIQDPEEFGSDFDEDELDIDDLGLDD